MWQSSEQAALVSSSHQKLWENTALVKRLVVVLFQDIVVIYLSNSFQVNASKILSKISVIFFYIWSELQINCLGCFFFVGSQL